LKLVKESDESKKLIENLKNEVDKFSSLSMMCDQEREFLAELIMQYRPKKILEIGVLNGKSLLTWREFYPNATIVGVDIDPRCTEFQNVNDNIYVEIGSQDNENFLSQVSSTYGPFDLILDDGSHMQSHIIFSFEKLFDTLKSDGVYVIEDSVTAYWPEYEGGFRKENTSVEYCKNLIDDVNFNGEYQRNFWSAHARREDLLTQQVHTDNLSIRTDIESINFLNSIIIITKR
jgi:predicted O-methyltransferase YrrM